MPSRQHLKILKTGVEAWNQWRWEHSDVRPNLRGADLRGARLGEANLRDANLRGADLGGAHLFTADLHAASLRGARLDDADLGSTKLVGADLGGAVLIGTQLPWADLGGANLSFANLSFADLNGADLSGAYLSGANLSGALLTRADLSGASVAQTIFANVDLSGAKGLDSVKHDGPSFISIDTLYKSQGRIPDAFLRDAGVPEAIIEIARALRGGPPVQWHAGFIRHSARDEAFARRLHGRMREAGLRVWLAPANPKGGRQLSDEKSVAVQLCDKLLLVLSPHSIKSRWLAPEVRRLLESEKKEQRRKLFLVRLADPGALRAWTCLDADSGKDLAVAAREHFIADFFNCRSRDAFEKAFEQLQKGLPAEERRGG